MYCSVVFYILVTAFVLVRGNHADYEQEYEFDKYKEVSCRDVGADIVKARINSVCKPREEHVILRPKKGYEYRPPIVSAKRCSGDCPFGFSPAPLTITHKSFAVQLHRKGNPFDDLKCVLVEVEEHTKCRCMCLKTENDCNDKQLYDQSSCTCVCKDQLNMKLACESRNGMMWDDKDCLCRCTNIDMGCQTGFVWSDHSCKCVHDRHML